MDKIKLTYIGGGSKQWARVFMNDLALTSNLSGEIALYDIDLPASYRNQAIGNNINNSPNTISKYNYVVYDNIEQALLGADFVVMSILPGTFEQMRVDVHTPEKYGIYQSVGDTAGPGGILRAMRTVPLYQQFARKIQQYCPNAWVINFTNPMSICVRALYDTYPQIKAFGCCHEVFHTQELLSKMVNELLGVHSTRKDIYTEVSGINHFTWITKATYNGKDIMPLFDTFCDKYFESGFFERGNTDDYKTNPFAYANRVKMYLYKKFGILPTGGDRHIAEFLNNKWFLSSVEDVAKWKFALTSVDYRINQMNERIAESNLLATKGHVVNPSKSDEEAILLIQSIMGRGDTISNVNLPNYGQMPNMPKNAIVETNAMFSNDKVEPLPCAPLPIGVTNLVSRALYNVEDCFYGIVERDLHKIFTSFVNQPLCSSLSISDAEILFKEMVSNTRQYLDEFYEIDKYLR